MHSARVPPWLYRGYRELLRLFLYLLQWRADQSVPAPNAVNSCPVIAGADRAAAARFSARVGPNAPFMDSGLLEIKGDGAGVVRDPDE